MPSFRSDLDDSSASKMARFIHRLARFICTMGRLTSIDSIKPVSDVYILFHPHLLHICLPVCRPTVILPYPFLRSRPQLLRP
ncbi:hypothetical protein BD309DRAFT_631609 [Dichomitus squalens]|nr:hypothetical protein BD309DRAFT_631609 [Dichomitus squalens]